MAVVGGAAEEIALLASTVRNFISFKYWGWLYIPLIYDSIFKRADFPSANFIEGSKITLYINCTGMFHHRVTIMIA